MLRTRLDIEDFELAFDICVLGGFFEVPNSST